MALTKLFLLYLLFFSTSVKIGAVISLQCTRDTLGSNFDQSYWFIVSLTFMIVNTESLTDAVKCQLEELQSLQAARPTKLSYVCNVDNQ